MEAARVIKPGCSFACVMRCWPCFLSPLIWRWSSCSPGLLSISVWVWSPSSICSSSWRSWQPPSSLPGRRASLTGNAKVATYTPRGWFAHLRQTPHHYFAIDGDSGAHLLAALAERHPYVRQAASPRHADVLLV